MKISSLVLIPLVCAVAEGKKVNHFSGKDVKDNAHNIAPKVHNTSAVDIFGQTITEKECIKCLPVNFCECECSCKNKTGFTMKHRYASIINPTVEGLERSSFMDINNNGVRECRDLKTSAGDGNPDVGYPDTGLPNTEYPDTGLPNTGYPDTGLPDTGYPDTGLPDTGYPDTGLPDTGYPDTGLPGTGYPDTGLPNTGYPDTGLPGVGGSVDPNDALTCNSTCSSMTGVRTDACVCECSC